MFILKPLFIILFITTALLSQEPITINDTIKSQEILSKSEIFIDKTNSLDISNIKNQTFLQNDKSSLHYGYSPGFTAWIRFTLYNNTDKKINKTLEYANPITTHIDFYDGKKVYTDGLFQLNLLKDSINPIFDITLKPHETKTYYLKTTSHVTTLIIKLNLVDTKLYQKESFKHQMILAMFFAAMLILAVYNFFIYFFTKDKNYLFYLLYIVGLINHQLFYTGFGNMYIFSQKISTIGVSFAEFYVAMTVFIFALLVRSFLNIKQYKSIDKFFNICLAVFPFFVTIVWYFEIYNIRNLFSFILLIITTVVVIYAIYKRNRQAYFVGFGWLMFSLAVGFMYLSSAGVVDIFVDFKYLVEIALVLEALIFSIALVDKINQLEYQKNKATMQLVLKEQTEKHKLEKIVKQKTKDLEEALDEKSLLLKELNHRVKNNMQTIVSLIRLQSDKLKDDDTKELLNSIKNRINAMGSFHELLYNQDNISYINTKRYFHMLTDELQDSFNSENIIINYDIKTNLKTEEAIYCGLIVNEIITNALKHAFKDQNGQININLEKHFNNYILTITDNGIGYDPKTTKENLGSVLVKSLVAKQLKGKIEKKTKDGVKITITWQ